MSTYISPYKAFIFETYEFNHDTKKLILTYSFDEAITFTETVEFYGDMVEYDAEIIDSLAFYYWILAGTSYYKAYLAPTFVIKNVNITQGQADFFNFVYSGGLSQYLYENKLTPQNLATFQATSTDTPKPHTYNGNGILLMESGGKDSILSAELLKKAGQNFTSWHMSSTGNYPKQVFDLIGKPHRLAKRSIDLVALQQARRNGALNGHVPFSGIFAGAALIHAVLTGKQYVLASNEASADEGNIELNGFVVNHQFSKTYDFELALQNYIHTYVSPELQYASLLRPLSEVKVAQLFADLAWPRYRNHYTSCNLANYKQGRDNGELTWDGTCPKCANTFLLFAPFVAEEELLALFAGKNLMLDPSLRETFRQLLGQSDVKPFECVATFDEMNYVYKHAKEKSQNYSILDIEPSDVDFNPDTLGPYQELLDQFIDFSLL